MMASTLQQRNKHVLNKLRQQEDKNNPKQQIYFILLTSRHVGGHDTR
jgi:hypothetical protein